MRADNPLIRRKYTGTKNMREVVDKTTASRSLATPQAPSGASSPEAISSVRKLNIKKGIALSGMAASSAMKKGATDTFRAVSAVHGGLQSQRSEYLAVEGSVETAMKSEASRLGKIASKKAGQYAAKGTKAAVRAVGKLLSSLTQTLAKIIGGAAAPVVVIVAVVASIGLVLSSAFGILFDDGDTTTPTMEEIVSENEQRLQDKINEIYTSVHPEPDVVLMDFYMLSDGVATPISARLNNMADVMAVWASRTTMADNMDVIELDEQRQFLFQQVYDDMTSIDYNVSTETHTQKVTDADGNETEIEVTITTLLYSITSKARQEMYNEYILSNDAISMAEELTATPEFQEFSALAAQGYNPYPYPMTGGNRPGQMVDFTPRKLPPSALANDVVRIASEFLGTPYDELDCSKLTQSVFAQLEVSLPRTAAEQARYIINNGKAVLQSDLQAGDLIFYSLKGDNGRYMRVSHVAIYAGDGMIIDASSINGYTIYRDMDTFSDRTTVLYGRP
jgi:cell wall-associated NlpC family hydrolase